MKKLKKALLLGLTLAMSATLFAACGGKGDNGNAGLGDNITGEQLSDKAAFLQALEDTGAATNATVQIAMKSEERMGEYFEKEEGNSTVKLADGKIYEYSSYKDAWKYPPDWVVDMDLPEEGEESFTEETYYAAVDGVVTRYEKVEGEWLSYTYYEPIEMTVEYVIDYYVELGLGFVAERYDGFTYNNGVYTFTMSEEDEGTDSAELKFVDGKLAYGKIFGYDENRANGQDQVGSYSYEIAFTITYGNATVVLPGEEPDDGDNSSQGGSAGGSQGGNTGGGNDTMKT